MRKNYEQCTEISKIDQACSIFLVILIQISLNTLNFILKLNHTFKHFIHVGTVLKRSLRKTLAPHMQIYLNFKL